MFSTNIRVRRIVAILLSIVFIIGAFPINAYSLNSKNSLDIENEAIDEIDILEENKENEISENDKVEGIEKLDINENLEKNSIGFVYLSIKNEVYKEAEENAKGIILDAKEVEIFEGDNLKDAIKRAIDDSDIQVLGLDSGYISSVNGLAMGTGANYSGWMLSINDWFANGAMTDIVVEDKDEIALQFSLTMGEDIGSFWGNNDTNLKDLVISKGSLSPSFSPKIKEYTLLLDEGVDSIFVNPTAKNKNFQVRTKIGEKQYKRLDEVFVSSDSELVIACGDPSWPSMNESSPENEIEVSEYKITVKYSKDNSLDISKIKFVDALGNPISTVKNEEKENNYFLYIDAGKEQDKVLATVLEKPIASKLTYDYGTVFDINEEVEITLSTSTGNLLKEYRKDFKINLEIEEESFTETYTFTIVRKAITASADNANLLFKNEIGVKNINSGTVYNTKILPLDKESGKLKETAISNNEDLSLIEDDTFFITVNQPMDKEKQADIATVSFSPNPLFAEQGAKYSIFVNKTEQIVVNETKGTQTIPHRGGFVYTYKNSENVEEKIDVTLVEVVVHAADLSLQDKFYTYIIPKVQSEKFGFSNISIQSVSTYSYFTSEGKMLHKNDESKSGYNQDVLDYVIKGNYNVTNVSIKPQFLSADMKVSWKINDGDFKEIELNSKALLIADLQVGENLIYLKAGLLDNEKIYSFKVIREKNYNIAALEFSDGIVQAGVMRPTLLGITAISDKNVETYSINIKAEDSTNLITLTQGDKEIAKAYGDLNATLDSSSEEARKSVRIKIWDGINEDDNFTYSLSIKHRNPLAPSKTYSLMLAPGQYTNKQNQSLAGSENGFGWGEGWDTIIYGGDESGTPNWDPGISLGAYGGYVSYYFEDAIKNFDKNKYGADFIIGGNAFPGNSEPGGVMVAADKDGDGEPDKWYHLAGSEHYEDLTDWDYQLTYENPNPSFIPNFGVDMPWKDNKGNTGLAKINPFHRQSYYPIGKNYLFEGNPAKETYSSEKLTFEGVNINTVNTNFGYADVAASGSEIKGNPYNNSLEYFDIDWAVDENGYQFKLDEISFIKIYTNQMIDGGAIGEKSPEILSVYRNDKNNTSYGKTDMPKNILIKSEGFNDINVPLVEGQETVELDIGEMQYFKFQVEASDGDNIFINNQKIKSSEDTKISYELKENSERLVRVIVQNGEKEPYILTVKLTGNSENSENKESLLKDISLIRNQNEVLLSKDGDRKFTAKVPYATDYVQVKTVVNEGTSILLNGTNLLNNELSEKVSLTAGSTKEVELKLENNGIEEIYIIELYREAHSGGNTGQDLTVNFSIYAAPIHNGAGPNLIFAKESEKFETWISNVSYTVADGSTVLDVIDKAISSGGLDYKFVAGSYISAIKSSKGEWLEEFTNGQYSGWLYMVNKKYPLTGMAQNVVKDGDNIVLHYTDDFRLEESSEPWSSSGSLYQNEKNNKDAINIIVSPDKNGEINSILSQDKIDEIISIIKNLADNEKSITSINYSTINETDEINLNIPWEVLNSFKDKEKSKLKLKTEISSLSLDANLIHKLIEKSEGKDLDVKIKKLKEHKIGLAENVKINKQISYSISIFVGDKEIGDLNSLELHLPYSLDKAENASDLELYHESKGEIEKIENFKYENENIIFTVKNLSIFTILNKETIEENETKEELVKSVEPIKFSDIDESHWAKEYIDYLSSRGYINGFENNMFLPEKNLTRAEFVTFLFNISDEENVEYMDIFADVNESDWYAKYVIWAYENNIVKGVSLNSFAPNSEIKREDMALMIVNYLEYKKIDLSLLETVPFSDIDKVSNYAKEAVEKTQKTGLINGKGNNEFKAQDLSTRAEAAKIIALIHKEYLSSI